MKKISLTLFREIKENIFNIMKDAEEKYNNLNDEERFDFEEKLYQQIIDEESILFSYDLSDIPFEEWKDIIIIAPKNEILDLSNTKANIDFEYVSVEGLAIFNNCNIRNVNRYYNAIPEMFDSKTINENKNFFLSDNFSEEFKTKYYAKTLEIEALSKLNDEQIDEIINYNLENEIKSRILESKLTSLIDVLGLKRVINIYQTSSKAYDYISDGLLNEKITAIYNLDNDFIEKIKTIDLNSIEEYLTNTLIDLFYNKYSFYMFYSYPERFRKEYSDLFMEDPKYPEDLKNKYLQRDLTMDDVIKYYSLLSNRYIVDFLGYSNSLSLIISEVGKEEFNDLIFKYPKALKYIDDNSVGRDISKNITIKDNSGFVSAIKKYIIKNNMFNDDWTYEFNFQIIKPNEIIADNILMYNDETLIADTSLTNMIEAFGPNNLRRLEEESGLVSYSTSTTEPCSIMFILANYYNAKPNELEKFENGKLPYEKFEKLIANILDELKSSYRFSATNGYNFIQGPFREKNKNIFISEDASNELKYLFYEGRLTPEILREHPEYIEYLEDVNLSNCIRTKANICYIPSSSEYDITLPHIVNLIDDISKRFGNKKCLEILSRYGMLISDYFEASINNIKNQSEEVLDKAIMEGIITSIKRNKIDYSFLLSDKEFVAAYPEVVLDLSNMDIQDEIKEKLISNFCQGKFEYSTLKEYPGLYEALKGKDLSIPFSGKYGKQSINSYIAVNNKYPDLDLLKYISNDEYLELINKYGRYMEYLLNYIGKENNLSYELIDEKAKEYIYNSIINGETNYKIDDLPEFIKEEHPELLLSEDAPSLLKLHFYGSGKTIGLSFSLLNENKDFIPYLEGKNIIPSLKRGQQVKKNVDDFFSIFGDKAFKIGVQRAQTVDYMIRTGKVSLMKEWYDLTGGKFIPDLVIMENIPLEDADKFLTNATYWSNLMKIKSFASNIEGREAMLKLAYSFGAFDNDQRGFKKVVDLLTDIPRVYSGDRKDIIDSMAKEIDKLLENLPLIKEYESKDNLDRIINILHEESFGSDNSVITNLLEAIKKENVNIDLNNNIIYELYELKEDGYHLKLNPQNYPKTCQALREYLILFRDKFVISPEIAHTLFGSFDVKYDPDFREFLLEYLDVFLTNYDYARYIGAIQKRFKDIKIVNSNRHLTPELAIGYVQNNKYERINDGNEEVAKISSIAGYSQKEFESLQRIYNIGKQRTFSSIPRIEGTKDKYRYSILRLTDPAAMSAGTLCTCCQEIGNCAELDMEHSMVSEHGRLFLIKDLDGSPIAQSWVWRNKNVLCFDNIEIPNKLLEDQEKIDSVNGRHKFADEIYEIYKKAAKELIAEDERVLKELLNQGKITKEAYEGLKLSKVTVGLGYNDIKESIIKNSIRDEENTLPLPFDEPIKLEHDLYIKDSRIQYIVEGSNEQSTYNGKTPIVHSDEYNLLTNETLTESKYLTLMKLELLTKGNSFNTRNTSENQRVSDLASNYNISEDKIRVIVEPNFAIIYEEMEDKIIIHELLYNLTVNNYDQQIDITDSVLTQIKLAFDQIAKGKEINIYQLNNKQKEIFEKVRKVEESDIKRGVSYAR